MNINIGIVENAYNEKYYEKSFQFLPQRWLSTNSLSKDPYTFIPFSSGSRNCIGQHLALLETKIVIAKLISKYIVTLPQDYIHIMTLRLIYEPQNPMNFIFEKRK